MKKLLALIMAVVTVLSLNTVVFAYETETVDQFVTVNAKSSAEYYNPGNTFDVEITLQDITLDAGDGISAFDFELHYDSEMVSPIVNASEDTEGDECDFTSVIVNNPGSGWNGFGRLDSANSRYILGFADFNAANVLVAESVFTVRIPFTVKSGARVNDICFTVENVAAYNADLSLGCSIAVNNVVVKYALQPDESEKLPSDAVSIDIAGYKHDVNNVIFYAQSTMSVSDYVWKYMDPVNGQDQMTGFAVIIADSNGNIVNLNLSDGDKSQMTVPAGGFIIGIHSSNTADMEYLRENAEVGASVVLHNINVEATGGTEAGTALTNAGFIITDFAVKSEANAYFDAAEMTVTVYETDVTLEEFEDMFEGSITVLDQNGNPVTEGIITTGMTVDHSTGVTVVILGDCTQDGYVDLYDCLLLKSHILRGTEMSEAGYKAVCIVGEPPSMYDYLAVKSYYFGKTDFSQFKPLA